MFYGWEGNRRSDVALAMRHRLSGIYPPKGSMVCEREMSTTGYGIFTFTFIRNSDRF